MLRYSYPRPLVIAFEVVAFLCIAPIAVMIAALAALTRAMVSMPHLLIWAVNRRWQGGGTRRA